MQMFLLNESTPRSNALSGCDGVRERTRSALLFAIVVTRTRQVKLIAKWEKRCAATAHAGALFAPRVRVARPE
jgi:hypothetical protein